MGERLEQLWSDLVRAEPEAVAIVDGVTGETASRGELAEGARRWRETHAEAVRAGERVLFAEPNGRAWLEVFLGLLQAGAVPAAIEPGEPEASRLRTAAAVGAAWVWTPDGMRRVEGGIRRHRRRPDACLIKLTSGSTGTPRAMAFTHAQMIADGRHVCRTMDIRPDDVNLGGIPFGHSYGLGNLVVPLLVQGTAIVVAGSPLPHALAEVTARFRPTVFPTVPVVLAALVRADVPAGALASLRVVVSAGSALPPTTAREFEARFGRRVHGFYGSSETGGIAYDRTGDATLEGRSVGRPLEGVSIELRRGGRFRVSGAAVKAPGWHSPADRGRWNEHGELVLLGRTGRTLKLAGRRVELGEVEAALRALPGVTDAFATPHPEKPERLAAAVATALPVAEVRRLARGTLASWKVPDRWIVLEAFPVTARGKTDFARLRAVLATPAAS
jgi:acyl-coenzyme A synthetase/AMP-(fatty) acid ligase